MDYNNSFRQIPYSLEAEQSVLGAVLLKPESYDNIAGHLKSDDFYLEEHREIFEAMTEMFAASRYIDVITLIDTLTKRGIYDGLGAKNYIKVVAESVPATSNIRDYARIVKDHSLLRQLIKVSEDISEMAYEGKDEVRYIIDRAEQMIYNISDVNHQGGFKHIRELLTLTYAHLQSLAENKEGTTGAKTGFSDIDHLLVGMSPGELILIGARPGVGKTSFAMNIATAVAKKRDKAVCVFSLEMSSEQIVSRLLSSTAAVDSYSLRSGELNDEDWERMAMASAMLSECDIRFNDNSAITVTEMKSELRRVKNLGLVIIDYLGLMQSDKRSDNRVQEIGDISRNIKILAKDLNVPVIMCAQLNRGPESRQDKRPMLSDLRDSGAIEQDADVVMFLYRDDYYNKEEGAQSKAEVIIAKNRHGSTGKVELGFQGQYTRFISLQKE